MNSKCIKHCTYKVKAFYGRDRLTDKPIYKKICAECERIRISKEINEMIDAVLADIISNT